MREETFAYDPKDRAEIVNQHNQRVLAEECGECFHPIEKHGPEGCTCERTRDIEGSSETESGPCGCQAWEHEVLSEDEYAKAVSDAHFEALLENTWRASQKLRATNDTAAIAASNATFAEGRQRLARVFDRLAGLAEHNEQARIEHYERMANT